MRPLKILLLFSSQGVGGAERSLTRMALASSPQANEYVLASLGGDGAWASWCRALGAAPYSLGGSRAGVFQMVRAAFRLMRLWRRERPGVIYVIGLKAAVLVRLLRIFMPPTKIVHGIRTHFAPGTVEAKRFGPFERVMKFATDAYVCNSAIGAQTLKQLAGVSSESIKVIYNGIESKGPDIVSYAQRPMELCIVANITENKGHIPFLDVLTAVHKELPDLRYRFIGADTLNGKVQREVVARGLDSLIYFDGYQAEPEKYVRNARLLVLPSIYLEGSPTSILEAYLLGTPVVAYAIGGVPELIRHGEDGFLAPCGDKQALAAHIVKIVSTPALGELMGLRGRAKVLSNFTLERCAWAHAEYWKHLTGR